MSATTIYLCGWAVGLAVLRHGVMRTWMNPQDQRDILPLRQAFDLPALIKAERKRRGLSLRAAEAESGVSFTTLARFEQGRLPYLDCFFATAAWLNVSPDWLADAPVEGGVS